MTIRKILTEPDLFLRQKSIKVDNVDVNTQLSTIIDDLNGNDLNNFIKSIQRIIKMVEKELNFSQH